VFDITFLDANGALEYAWQTSWGCSTRLMGALVMAHGDDNGLRVPPALAPVEVVVLVVRAEDGAGEAAERLAAELAAGGRRVELDTRLDTSFGRRVVDWELKGVPVRVEVGPRDLARDEVVLVRRHRSGKDPVALTGVADAVVRALEDAQATLLAEAEDFRLAHTTAVTSVDDAVAAVADGFASLPLSAVGEHGETRLNESGVSVRCLLGPDGGPPPEGTPDDALVAVVGRAY
jgi:prolyl-tRNA synthetase